MEDGASGWALQKGFSCQGVTVVYVDDMFRSYGRMRMCHMLADTDDELHAMAALIGVRRCHWQAPTNTCGSHYDIAMISRTRAIDTGAVCVTQRQAAAMNARRRETGVLGAPDEAIVWWKQFRQQR